ncbi:hypothetical protein [Wolbachia endosymbiont of Armadillidium arcangelii]|uniref:Uncharacterized protein n=1 Tax=Wolbachia endosymbiont of Armadillidium arcangelii TaxID=3158571 RepID=A0AAU7Q2I4_9RICK
MLLTRFAGGLILIQAQNSGILQNVLAAKNTVHSPDGWTYSLTSLGFAIHEGNHAHINSILIQAQNSGLLQDVMFLIITMLQYLQLVRGTA